MNYDEPTSDFLRRHTLAGAAIFLVSMIAAFLASPHLARPNADRIANDQKTTQAETREATR